MIHNWISEGRSVWSPAPGRAEVISDAGRVGEPNLEPYSGAKAGAAGWITGQTYPVNGGYSFNQ